MEKQQQQQQTAASEHHHGSQNNLSPQEKGHFVGVSSRCDHAYYPHLVLPVKGLGPEKLVLLSYESKHQGHHHHHFTYLDRFCHGPRPQDSNFYYRPRWSSRAESRQEKKLDCEWQAASRALSPLAGAHAQIEMYGASPHLPACPCILPSISKSWVQVITPSPLTRVHQLRAPARHDEKAKPTRLKKGSCNAAPPFPPPPRQYVEAERLEARRLVDPRRRGTKKNGMEEDQKKGLKPPHPLGSVDGFASWEEARRRSHSAN